MHSSGTARLCVSQMYTQPLTKMTITLSKYARRDAGDAHICVFDILDSCSRRGKALLSWFSVSIPTCEPCLWKGSQTRTTACSAQSMKSAILSPSCASQEMPYARIRDLQVFFTERHNPPLEIVDLFSTKDVDNANPDGTTDATGLASQALVAPSASINTYAW